MKDMKTLTCALAIILTASLNAIAQNDFEDFVQQQQDEFDASVAEADAAVFSSLQDYDSYIEEQERLFNEFRDEMMREWGSFRERTKKNWVEYQNGGKVRWDVDFETGDGTVEVLADEEDDEASLRASIEDAVAELIQSKGTETEMPDEEVEVLDEPVLADQVNIPEGMDVPEYAKEIAKTAEIKEVQGEDGEVRKIAVLNLKLIPDHLRVRASKFQTEVETYSSQYKIDPALVLAIIHTESFFNPMAKSHANALGLMQIVPRTAGRDVYRILNGKDAVPSAEYLFKPDQNVLYGSTYVDLLMNRYMKGITNKTVHEYLVICAYNTGAGNVARAYTGNTNFNEAREKINSLNAEENYNFLLENLPWDETKSYLVKVSERRRQYREWMNLDD